jgi:hypothetical protein
MKVFIKILFIVLLLVAGYFVLTRKFRHIAAKRRADVAVQLIREQIASTSAKRIDFVRVFATPKGAICLAGTSEYAGGNSIKKFSAIYDGTNIEWLSVDLEQDFKCAVNSDDFSLQFLREKP